MVRNKGGGNRNRRSARKSYHVPVSTAFRKAVIDGEMYARVTKMFGGGMADILCNDGVKRLLIIRRNFRGKNKRDNFVALGSIILVGIRLWEVVCVGKKPKADLLYIYSKYNISELKKLDDFSHLLLPEEMSSNNKQENGVEMKEHPDFDENDKARAIVEDVSPGNVIITSDMAIDFDDI